VKIGIFSDLHLIITKKQKIKGWDKRLIDGLRVLQQIFDIFEQKNVDMIIFLGDLINSRYNINVALLYALVMILEKYKNKFPMFFLVGNHDKYFTKDIHSLKFLNLAGFQVIDKNIIIEENDIRMKFMPYKKEISEKDIEFLEKENADILFLHQCIEGIPIVEGYEIKPSEVVIEKKLKKLYSYIFSGHIHHPYVKDNIINVGASMHIRFGEKGERHCWILNTDTLKVETHQLDFPKFITLTEDDDLSKIDDDNYYRIQVSEDKIKDIPKKSNIEIQMIVAEKSLNRLRISDTWTLEEVIKKYVEYMEKPKKYEEVGLSLLKGDYDEKSEKILN